MIYNLFISHSWKHNTEYENLEKLLNNASNFNFKNYSVPINNPIHNAPNSLALEQAIYDQMRPASAIIILAGVYATYSKWINIEIKLAQQMKKKIIAVEGRGSERTSAIVKQSANEIVKWNTNSVINAIKN